MKRLLLVVFLFSFSVPLLAQQGSTSGVQFIAPMQISIGKDSNFLVDRTDPNQKLLVLSLPASIQPAAPDIRPKLLDDRFFLLTLPKIAYLNESRRHDFLVSWVPEFEVYQHNGDQNAMNQEATIAFNYFLTRNIQIAAGDTYRATQDPARTLQNVFLLVPRTAYRDNAIRASLDIQPNAKTSLGVRYDTNYTKFGQTDQFQARMSDTRSTGYTFTATRMLTRNSRLRAIYSLFTIEPLDRAEVNDDRVDVDHLFERKSHAGSLQYKVGLNRGTILGFGGGVIRLDTGWNYIFSAGLDKRLATYYWLTTSYSRTLAYLAGPTTGFAQGLGSNGFYDVARVRFAGQTSRKTNLLLDAILSRNASNRIIESNKAAMGRARFDYRLSDRSVLFGLAETYQQNRNLYVLAPLARNRFSVGIEISFASDLQRRTNNLNEDDRYVPLTDHPRRRENTDQQED